MKTSDIVLWRTVSTCLLVLNSTACHPAVKQFDVLPQGYCSTTSKIRVQWETKNGSTTLLVDPPDATPRKVDDTGSVDLEPRDMTITLSVTKGKRTEVRPINVRAVGPHALSGLAKECEKGWVTTEPAQFGGKLPYDADAHPSVINNKCSANADSHATCRRKIQVVHDRWTWEVSPDSVLDVSTSRAALTGDWVLKAQLLPGEVCGTPSASAAKIIELNLEINCARSVP